MLVGLIPAPDYQYELEQELGSIPIRKEGDLWLLDSMALKKAPQPNPKWIRNRWDEVVEAPVASIAKSASLLKAIQRNWVHFPVREVRRGELISEQLPSVGKKPLRFGAPVPSGKLGSFSLISKEKMLYASITQSPFANGDFDFEKAPTDFCEGIESPSSAYKKVLEAWAYLGQWPQNDELILDLGCTPGSWSWAALGFGASVVGVDGAAVESSISSHPRFRFIKGDAFDISFESYVGSRQPDWVVCDVICDPLLMLEWLQQSLKQWPYAGRVCTLKFKGKSDLSVIRQFENLPGGKLLHLRHNKHELCWIRQRS